MNKEINYEYYKKVAIKLGILAFLAIGIFISFKVAIFYLPFLIALGIATILEPIIRLFSKRFKRKSATTITLLLVIVLLGTILTIGIMKFAEEINQLVSNLNPMFKDIYDWGMGLFQDFQEGKIEISDGTMKMFEDSFGSILNVVKNIALQLFTNIINTIGAIPTILTYAFITILAIIFICFDKEYIKKQIKIHVPSKWIEKVKIILNETFRVAVDYIKAEAKLSGICFILVLVSLLVMNLFGLGVDYPVTMAIFIGFVDLLPLFGAGTVMLPWSVYLFLRGNIPLAIAIIVLWVIWAMIKQIIEPKMVSKQMGMNPIFTLIGMYTGFRFCGVIGLILGPIILLILRNILGELMQKGILKSFFELD